MNSEELWQQRTQDDIENNKSAIKEHEIRIRKLEESNIKMELQLNEISKGQLELKNLMYETQKENRKSDELMMNKDRKSTRLNSSHANISYAVFCLKKKNE